jgi:two-component system phosphate regulon sensor histidine kinase PhoR
MESHRTRPEIDAALANGTGTARRVSPTINAASAYFALRINDNEKTLGVVRTSLTLATAEAQARQLVNLVAMVGGISLLATVAVIYLVSRQLSTTIQELTESAARFSVGDLGHRIPRPPSHELAALADVLNVMAGRLNEQIDLLQSQRNEQQAIYQSMSNGMLALDNEQRVLSLNRAAASMLGIAPDQARGRLIQEVVREPALNRFVASALTAETIAPSEFRLGSGQGPMVQAVGEPLRNVRDQPAGLLVVLNDVTHLRRLESIRSDFAANVSHELRTPITNIRGYVETLLDVGVDDQRQAVRFLDVIKRNTDRLASIVEDLLALAHLEQPGRKVSLERIASPVHRIVDSVINQFEPQAAGKRIRIDSNVPPELMAMVNAPLVEQALGNLLSNAIMYSPTDTVVTVSARQADGNDIQIAVADPGPGIEAEHLPRIFERFYRVDKARSRELGGTGLGLAIVKHIALVHGGRIDVESEIGHGSVFRITLPSPDRS